MCIFLSHSPEGESLGPTQNVNHTLDLYTSSNEHWKTVKKREGERKRNKSKQKQETEKAKDKTIILIYFRRMILADKGSEE